MPHHLNNYKTIENVFDDKIYLVRNLMPGGTAVVNFDDERLAAFQYECKVVSFGIETELDVDYRAANIEQDGSILRMDIEHNGKSTKVESTITGKHNAYNILAAFAVGKIMDVKEEDIAKGIREYSASGTRQNVVQYGNNALFMDCYNVCNETIIKSVEILEEMDVPDGGRRIAIVGGENKLGASRVEITEELGRELDFELDKPYGVVTFHPVTLENNSAVIQLHELLKVLHKHQEMKFIITKANADQSGELINNELDGVTLHGGEPLDQADELLKIVKDIKEFFLGLFFIHNKLKIINN